MHPVRGQRFLLTQSFLYSYGGSEVITLELVEHLSAAGAEVVLAVHGHDEAVSGQISALPGVRLFRMTDPALADALAERPVDIAWIHQQLVPPDLLRAPGGTTFVFSHLSSVHPLEFPFAHRVESGLASAVVFPSEGAKTVQVASGLLDDVPGQRLHVSGNPCPDAFAEARREPVTELTRLLVVSNHLPAEELEAIELLRARLDVTVVGLQAEHGAVVRRVDPELIGSVDAVLTIGKTVQYAVMAGVPVYCYDHFGGPGWLGAGNIDQAAQMHFSGKGFSARTGEEIAREVVDGFAGARDEAPALARSHGARYSLSAFLDRVLTSASAERPTTALEPADVEAHVRLQESLGTFMVMGFELAAAHQWSTARVAELEAALEPAGARIAALEADRVPLAARNELLEGEVQELRREVERGAVVEAELAELRAAYVDSRRWIGHLEADLVTLRDAVESANEARDDALYEASVAHELLASGDVTSPPPGERDGSGPVVDQTRRPWRRNR